MVSLDNFAVERMEYQNDYWQPRQFASAQNTPRKTIRTTNKPL